MFIRLNPNVTSACNLTTNERYCLKPQPAVLPASNLKALPANPHAVPSDTIEDCALFDRSSDRAGILVRHNLTDFGFLLMNPSARDNFEPNAEYCAVPMGNSTVVDQSFIDKANDEPIVHGISFVPRPSSSASGSSAVSSSGGVSSVPPPSTTANGSSAVSSTGGNSVSSIPPPSTTTSGSSAVSTVIASQSSLLSVNGISEVPRFSTSANGASVTSTSSGT